MKLGQNVNWRSWQCRYALAVIAVLGATALRSWLSGLLHPQPFPTFFMAVLVVAVIVGPGPAVLATFLSGISAVYFFMEPQGAFKAIGTSDLIRLVIFTSMGVGLAALTEAMSRARQAATDVQLKFAEAQAREVAEDSLRASEEFVRGVLDSLPHEIVVIDKGGVILAANEPWKRSAGYNAVPNIVSIGVNYLSVSRIAAASEDEFARGAFEGLQALLNGEGHDFKMEYPRHAPNRQRWFMMHAARTDCGRAAVVISHTDITERKRAEEALRESEERFASFMRHLPGLAWIKDTRGRYVFARAVSSQIGS